MKIGIVGGGIAGLAAAWMLDGEHQVVLFEKNEQPGGHAHTMTFEHQGHRLYADTAFNYFSAQMYPYFSRLLRLLEVPSRTAPMTLTVYSRPAARALLVTPAWQPRRLAPLLRPGMLPALRQVQQTIQAAAALDARDDWSTSLEAFVEALTLSPSFKTRILYPWAASLSGVSIADIKTFSARAALKYPVHHQPKSLLATYDFLEVEGGVAAYVRALQAALATTEVKTGCEVQGLERAVGHWIVVTDGGARHACDHLILAAPAHAAVKLVAGLAGAEGLHALLRRFRYVKTSIAVHSDPSLMPARRADWSSFNALWDGQACQGTMWYGYRTDVEYFKSWVTFNETLPRELHGLYTYFHPLMTPDYYQAQRQLGAFQGRENLWLAGSYLQDVDSHESGLRSAVDVVQRLQPQSARLGELLNRG